MYKLNIFLFTIIQFVILIDGSKQMNARQAITAVKVVGKTLKRPFIKTFGNTIKNSVDTFNQNKNTIKNIAYGIQEKYFRARHSFGTMANKYVLEEKIKFSKYIAPWGARLGKKLASGSGKKNTQKRSGEYMSRNNFNLVIKRSTRQMMGKGLASLIYTVSKSKPQLPLVFAAGGLDKIIHLNLVSDQDIVPTGSDLNAKDQEIKSTEKVGRSSKVVTRGKLIGICGGLGPAAGLLFHNKILLNTLAKKNREHLNIVHFSDLPENLKDGSVYLDSFAKDPETNVQNPGKFMGQIGINISQLAYNTQRSAILCVPCNSFHAKPIFDVYEKTIHDYCKKNNRLEGPGSVQIVHLVNSTIEYIKEKGYRTIGVASTNDTRQQGLYRKPFEDSGLKVVEVENQDDIHQCVNNSEYGVKALSYPHPKAVKIMDDKIIELISKGAEVIILGCTEIPLLITGGCINGKEIVDPMTIMCRKTIKLVNPNKLAPEQGMQLH